MKTSNYFYIAFYGTLGLFFSSLVFGEIRLGWLGMFGIIISWVPIVVGLSYFEKKESKMEHEENCKCTCGNCCERQNNKRVEH